MNDEPNNAIETTGEPAQQPPEAIRQTAPAADQAAEPAVDAARVEQTAPPAETTPVAPPTPVEPAPAPAEVVDYGGLKIPEPEPFVPFVPRVTPSAPKPAEVRTGEPLPKSDKMCWYILKVQSNREDSIREGLQRRVKIAGLDQYFGNIIVPIEKVTEFKGGKKRVVKRKLYPGYLVVQMEINEESWFLIRETPGIGDFTGSAGHPSPMLPQEVDRIVARQEGEKGEAAPVLKIKFQVGDHIKITEGTFENFEGDVENIDQSNGRVTVMINIFGRSTPVELEYWQIESV